MNVKFSLLKLRDFMLKKNKVIIMIFVLNILFDKVEGMQKIESIEKPSKSNFLKDVINQRYKDFDSDNLNKKNQYGSTIMDIAIYNNDKEIVKLILKSKDFDINYLDDNDNTFLMKAAAFGRSDILLLLINGGADLKIVNKQGYTALDLAQKYDNIAIVELIKNAEKERSKKIDCSIF